MTTRRKLYLAGPMRGKKLYNGRLFLAVARKLRDWGYDVTSPWERDVAGGMDPSRDLEEQGFDIHGAFKWDFETIMSVDGMVLLPGWENSKGVAAELVVAFHVGTPVYECDGKTMRRLDLDEPKIKTVLRRGS